MWYLAAAWAVITAMEKTRLLHIKQGRQQKPQLLIRDHAEDVVSTLGQRLSMLIQRGDKLLLASKHEALAQCWADVGSSSTTMGQQQPTIGPAPRFFGWSQYSWVVLWQGADIIMRLFDIRRLIYIANLHYWSYILNVFTSIKNGIKCFCLRPKVWHFVHTSSNKGFVSTQHTKKTSWHLAWCIQNIHLQNYSY